MPSSSQPGVIFNTTELIKNEYNPTGLASYIGMVLNAEKRARLAEVLSIRDDATAKASALVRPASPATQTAPIPPSTQTIPTPASPQTTPAPASPAPIAAVPLATVKASPPPAPLEKKKGWYSLLRTMRRTPWRAPSSKGARPQQ
ncbi:uncharacterized protein [Phaseolus vulgaris]|uniref:uncharacterized protein n=1 Tax=Phaseolus vulgaris TaxID=3885 RepID=UPI0035C964C8